MTNTQNTTSAIIKLSSGDHFAIRTYTDGTTWMTSSLTTDEIHHDYDHYEYDHEADELHNYETVRSETH